MNIAGFIKGLLDCEKRNCKPPQKFTTRYGPSQKQSDNFNKVLKRAGAGGLKNLKDDLYRDLGLEGVDLSFGSCTPGILLCGPPSIAILGGGGTGATASAIINNVGQVIGANILNGGSGYFSPPYVSIIDSCENGEGAKAEAVIENGQVSRILITEPGSGYLNNQTYQEIGSEPTEIPSDNNNDINSNSYVTQLTNVDVDTIGLGYGTDTSVIVVPGDDDIGQVTLPEFDLSFGPNGSVVEVKVTRPGYGFTQLPEISLISMTGAGARLKPSFKFIQVNREEEGELGVGRVVKVVDCVQK
jgi:hypothetical protein